MFAVFGTMAVYSTLGLSLSVIGSLIPFGPIGLKYATVVKELFSVGELFSGHELVIISGSVFFAARLGYAGCFSTTLIGMIGTALLHFPFSDQDIHPLKLVLFGGAMAFVFWMLIKLICKRGLTPPQTTKIPS